MSLQQHPLSAAFPPMTDVDFDALAQDIKENGLREPVTVLDNMVLDGWHRYRACKRVGAVFRCVPFDGPDPVAFVRSKNWHRRHLTASQKAAAEVAIRDWKPRGSAKSAPGADLRSAEEMAREAGVSTRTIEHAKAAHEAGLGGAVIEGKVSAKRAAEIAKLPKAKREKALTEKPKVVKAHRDFERLYEEVKSELAETKEALATLADTAASVEVFKNDEQFKAMQILREEMRSVKRRRDELMRENAELKKQVSHWKKKAEKK
jgi:hypothetical protein